MEVKHTIKINYLKHGNMEKRLLCAFQSHSQTLKFKFKKTFRNAEDNTKCGFIVLKEIKQFST